MAVDKQVPASPINYAQLKAAIDEELAKLYNRAPVLLLNVSGVNSITAETDPATTSLVAGNSFWLIPSNNNTGPAELSINGITAFDLVTQNGEPLGGNSLVANGRYLVFYDGDKGVINFGGDQGPPGVKGDAGEDGVDGTDGVDAGLVYDFTGVSGVPGPGEFTLNNTDLEAVTEIDINPIDALGGDVNNYIIAWDDSTNLDDRGSIIIRSRLSQGSYAIYRIIGDSIHNSTHITLSVEHVASDGELVGSQSIQFYGTGDKGTDGAGAGDVTAAANIGDNRLVRGDGGLKGIQGSGITVDDSDNISGVVNIVLSGNVDGRDLSVDGAKLDTIESGATQDQTASEIEALGFSFVTGDEYSGEHDFSGAVSLRMPVGASTTIGLEGEVVLDTGIGGFVHSILKYFAGEEIAVPGIPIDELDNPTDGHVLSYNATKQHFELTEGGSGGGAYSFISSTTVSDQAQADIELPDGFNSFEIFIIGLQNLGSGDEDFDMLVSDDGGTTFETGASDYDHAVQAFSGGGHQDNADDSIQLCASTSGENPGAGANDRGSFHIQALNTKTSGRKQFIWTGGYNSDDGEVESINGYGSFLGNTNALDYLRFFFDGGEKSANMNATIVVFGRTHS